MSGEADRRKPYGTGAENPNYRYSVRNSYGVLVWQTNSLQAAADKACDMLARPGDAALVHDTKEGRAFPYTVYERGPAVTLIGTQYSTHASAWEAVSKITRGWV